MSSRSSSSSPDVLGPPGDADYLISSPMKPFAGRQSWLSPANFKLIQTPRKRQRISLSPAKSSHSIRFDDILLPASPTMKLNGGRQRSISPGKGPSDGNGSPWRIRVTLEASQEDEENNDGSPSRKRLKPATTTMKVPLKGEGDSWQQTPKRRRGRPRKSDIHELDATPNAGSPGHTPGPGTSGQKRKRGRPRKSLLGSTAIQTVEADPPTPAPEPEQSQHSSHFVADGIYGDEFGTHMPRANNDAEADGQALGEQEQRWSPLDLAADGYSDDGLPDHEPTGFQDTEPDHPTPGPDPEQRRSPLDIAADADSDDEMPATGLLEHDAGTVRFAETVEDKSSPRRFGKQSPDTPNGNSEGFAYTEREEEAELRSAPFRIPSPSRKQRHNLMENTLHAGHTPRLPRFYPTPTSSSLVDEEKSENKQEGVPGPNHHAQQDDFQNTDDPTDEHREFDSIMESEGFSMVSLDTLPSAKQHGLSSDKKMLNGALKPFMERQTGNSIERIKRKSLAMNGNTHQEDQAANFSQANSTSADYAAEDLPPAPSWKNTVPDRSPEPQTSRFKQTPEEIIYPSIIPPSPATAPTIQTLARKKRPVLSLRRVVCVGIALQGILRQHEVELQSHYLSTGGSDNGNRGGEIAGSRKRLEHIFSELDSDSQRVLQAGLRFGERLASRLSQSEAERARERAATEIRKEDVPQIDESEAATKTPQRIQDHEGSIRSLDSEMKRREAEWQREREAVSRQIEMANSSQVIVIDSDESAPQSPQNDRDVYYPELQSDSESEVEPEPDPDPDPELEYEPEPQIQPGPESDAAQETSDEEDGYEDIWQQEAQSYLSHHSSINGPEEQDHRSQRRPKQTFIPWKRNEATASSDGASIPSPARWIPGQDGLPPLGESRVKQLREQEVDLSALLHARDTPNRARYYYGNSSPLKVASEQSPERRSTFESPQEEVNGHNPEVDDQPDIDQDLSPENSSDSGRTHDDDVSMHDEEQRERESLTSELGLEGEENRNVSDAAVADEPTVQENPETTPDSTRPANTDIQASSWFKKITSFTPGWLRAPNTRPMNQHIPPLDEELSEVDEELPNSRPIEAADTYPEDHDHEDMEETPRPSRFEEHIDAEPSPLGWNGIEPVDEARSPVLVVKHDQSERPRPLSISGFFSNDHYVALRRLYRLEKRSPGLFPYYPSPSRTDIVGDWIWTSDGTHGVPVTEGQFAIVDQFVRDLAEADLEYGGNGQVGWTEAELHRRLISIIIGEQIRAERKAKAREEEARRHSIRGSSRQASVETWRR